MEGEAVSFCGRGIRKGGGGGAPPNYRGGGGKTFSPLGWMGGGVNISCPVGETCETEHRRVPGGLFNLTYCMCLLPFTIVMWKSLGQAYQIYTTFY